jgi:hypothetical protein
MEILFEKKQVSVKVNDEMFFDFQCLEKINCDESNWSLETVDEDGSKYLYLNLQKKLKFENWKTLCLQQQDVLLDKTIVANLTLSNNIFMFLEGGAAKNAIQKILKNYKSNDIFVTDWLNKKKVKCFILESNGEPKSFALLKKMDFDPLGKHLKDPYMLEYIFTFETERRKNFAFMLLTHMQQQKMELSVCYTDNSVALFKKANFVFEDDDGLFFNICTFP